jgi:hemerythrin-like domain-containing protein
MMKQGARSIIEGEHRSLAAVLQAMQYLVQQIRQRGVNPDFQVFRAMIHYIDTFTERFHHPKEDHYLFRLLRRRTASAAAVLNDLESEHKRGAQFIRNLEQALLRYEEGGGSEFPAFAKAVDEYAQFHWRHMRTEEDVILPLAQRELTEDDWHTIDAAFQENADPLLDQKHEEDFHRLFARIVTLAPAPIGFGPVQKK